MNSYPALKRLYYKGREILQHRGLSTLWRTALNLPRFGLDTIHPLHVSTRDYRAWQQQHEQYDQVAVERTIAKWTDTPRISIIVPVYNIAPQWLDACFQSLLDQYYPHWQLSIYDDASTDAATRDCLTAWSNRDPRIVINWGTTNHHISGASNSALTHVDGTFVGLLDADDVLPPWALYEVAQSIAAHPDGAIWYSDEDKLNGAGERVKPLCKPDWNPDLLRSMMYTSHLTIYRRTLLQQLKGFRSAYDGAQDYDLMLRATRLVRSDQIIHIPAILYHWREIPGSTALGAAQKPLIHQRSRAALVDYLHAEGIHATVQSGIRPGRHAVIYAPPKQRSWMMVRLPNKIKLEDLYNYLITNIQPQTTPLIALLHNDVDPITATNDWKDHVAGILAQPGVGAVRPLIVGPNRTFIDPQQFLPPILHQSPRLYPAEAPGYSDRFQSMQTVDSLPIGCILLQRSTLLSFLSAPPSPTTGASLETLLSDFLRQTQQRIVYTPLSQFKHSGQCGMLKSY
jgi:hypothetical protein